MASDMLFFQTRLDLSHDVLLPLIRRRVDSALQMQLLPALGLQPIVQIRPAAVHMWFDDCSRTAPGGANRRLGILKQIEPFAKSTSALDLGVGASSSQCDSARINLFDLCIAEVLLEWG